MNSSLHYSQRLNLRFPFCKSHLNRESYCIYLYTYQKKQCHKEQTKEGLVEKRTERMTLLYQYKGDGARKDLVFGRSSRNIHRAEFDSELRKKEL